MGNRLQKSGMKHALKISQFFGMGLICLYGFLALFGIPGCLWYEPIRERPEDPLDESYEPRFITSVPEAGLTKAFTPCEKIRLKITQMTMPDDLDEYPNLTWRWFRNETEYLFEGSTFLELPIGEEGDYVVIDVIVSDQGFLYDLDNEDGSQPTGKEMRQTPPNAQTDQMSWTIEFIYREVPEENRDDPDSCYQVK